MLPLALQLLAMILLVASRSYATVVSGAQPLGKCHGLRVIPYPLLVAILEADRFKHGRLISSSTNSS